MRVCMQFVSDQWSLTADLRAQYLRAQGFLVLKVDNRGSYRRGLAFEMPVRKRMGTVEVDDQVPAIIQILLSMPLPVLSFHRLTIAFFSI